ncbi:Centriole, cilia and spindle-associated protein [Frankliniella fusca]|uniref:Centriole, cilia and spindle-associated protein n=1 Tax=Frankliniella fusca TaxID=407009 RepID=A0AAE1HB80_9NEOP|nr:Centriole, cilia and spindle-associated protein [Frankliniella fusca]
MVHKKSEYGLQFLRLSNELRAQIWQENVKFREAQKRLNLSDHYWRYQLIDDTCDCDEDSNAPDESIRSDVKSIPRKSENLFKSSEEKGVQTTDIEKVTRCKDENTVTQEPSVTLDPNMMNISEETTCAKPANSSHNSSPSKHSSVKRKSDLLKKSLNLKDILCYQQNDNYSQIADDVSLRRSVYSRLNRSPTRNALKSYHSEERGAPVFASFGWNDTEKDVGDQKTYNIRAPAGQVQPSALLASANRLKELESHLNMEWKRRQQERQLHHQGPVNLSGIWMTEYQENFSKGQREPLIRKTFARPIVWRIT